MNRPLEGRHVLVTGASRGLGRAIALECLMQGAHVDGVGRDAAALADTRTALAAIGGSFTLTQLDICDEAAVTAYIAALPAVDVVVNNAGIARQTPFLDTPTAELRAILEINVVAAFVVAREAVRRMAGGSGGLLINIASMAAVSGISTMAPYCASKHALLGMGRAMQEEFAGRNIRVTTFCPGPVTTEILGNISNDPAALPPAEVARTVAHLAALPASVQMPELQVVPTYAA